MNCLKYAFIVFMMVWQRASIGQEQVLFEVEGESVYLDEFLYIYEKTNRDEASFSKASIDEYLDLYTKFKLKVHKAKEMKLDTIKALQNELAGYHKQLASTYLSDKEVIASLTKEAFDRMQKDVDFSHILLKVGPSASKEAEEIIYQKAMAVLERLRSGEDFAKVALELSDDGTVKKNEGRIGYVTALLPDGFYELETALYTLPTKSFSEPIRSKLGYHLVMVNKRRPARGEMEVSQILLRSRSGAKAKERIDELYSKLQAGQDFSELAKNFSEDKATAPNGGYLGFFGINKYESIFENTAFRIRQDDAFSKPIKTSIGWHIIKRHSIKPKPAFDDIKRTLETQVKKDGRFAIAESTMLDKIKTDNDFKQLDWDQDKFITEIGDEFLTYKWKAPANHTVQQLATIGKETFTSQDLLDFFGGNTATRLRINRSTPPQEALSELYNEFLDEAILKFEEGQLEGKFPEFKALMREYSEGILLFEATKMKVWDRASEDTVGLKSFYRANTGKYMWPERAHVESIVINDKEISLVNKVVSHLAKKPASKVLKKFNKKKSLVQITSNLITKEELDPELTWSKYSMTTPNYPENRNVTMLKRIGAIVPPQKKSLSEARGYIIADYQDHLEKQWVSDLKKEFKVVVNEDVLNSIVK